MTAGGRFSALALLSAGGLVFEIALTRLLSALYFNSFVYVVLSAAVLGIGFGAALATAAASLRRPALVTVWMALAGLTAAIAVPLVVALGATGGRAASIAIVVVPYTFVGLAIAALFAGDPEDSPRLYLADLAGAGAGGMLAAPVLDLLGGVGATLAGAALLGAAAPLAAPRRADRAVALAVPLATLLLIGGATAGWPRVDYRTVATPKPIAERLDAGGRVAATHWDALARTDLVIGADGARFVYLDGGAGSLVPRLDDAGSWARDVGAFAFESVAPQSAYLLGSGGGLDVALARRHGVDTIVAVEVNRGPLAFSRQLEPGLYDGVQVVRGEGRTTLSGKGAFDLVLLSQTVTQNAELHGIALTENALYTVEAFRAYLAHLTRGGAVALKLYDELTLTRAMTTALAALSADERTVADATRHLMAVLDPRASPPVPLLLVRAEPFDRDLAVAYARAAERLGFALLYVPGLLEPPPLDELAAGVIGLDGVVAASPGADLTPPTDDRPFFWQFEPGIPRAMRPLLWTLALLVAAAAIAVAVGAARAARRRNRRATVGAIWGLSASFGLGAGFMLAEVTLLQRIQLLVGEPALALGATLGVLLVGAGVGSALSSRWAASPFRVAAVGSALVVVTLAAAGAAWGPIVASVEGATAWARLVVGLVPVAVVALAMGVPFPHVLRGLGRAGGGVAAAWAVNGLASVVGAVGATVLAVVAGFPAVAAAAALAYASTLAACAAAHASSATAGSAAGNRDRFTQAGEVG